VRDGWLNVDRMYVQMLNTPSLLSMALFDAGASAASPIAAFGAGVVSFLSPCVLPLVPGYISMISGATVETLQEADRKLTRNILLNSLMFILGFSVVFVSLGAVATTIGQITIQYHGLLSKIAGAVIILFGLHLTGIFKIKALYADKRLHNVRAGSSPLGSFVIGFAFAFGWTPCIGPILGGILVLAGSQDTVTKGVLLLATYSLGLAVPFLITSIGINQFLSFYGRFRRHLRKVEIVSGVLLIIFGVLIAANKFTILSGYLSFLNRFAL
jgi:cytochrome c-type biogenesis protein